MPPKRTGRPPYGTGHYDFAAHFDHLALVAPHLAPTYRDLHARCGKAISRSKAPLSFRQFMSQIRGRTNYHPRLPDVLATLLPLAEFGVAREHWLDLAKFRAALKAIAAAPASPEQLRNFLDERRKTAPMPRLDLVPDRQPRRIGEDDPRVPRLSEGPHRLRYRAGAPNGATIHLLLLEYDEHRNEWVCANRVKGVNLDIQKPLRAEGSLPVPIMSSPGRFSVFAIAGPAPFHDRIVALVEGESIATDGLMSAEVVDKMIKALRNEPRQARLVGRFRYRVS